MKFFTLVLILEPIEDIFNDEELRKKTLKITDFGLAKRQMNSSSASAAGTYPWMSPECIRNGEYSVKSDVWRFVNDVFFSIDFDSFFSVLVFSFGNV